MNQKLPHLYLKNPFGSVRKFNKARAVTDSKPERKDPEAYRRHKEKLSVSFLQLKQDRVIRMGQKTIVPESIDIVEIRFLIPFSDGAVFNTRTRFFNEFGLSLVMQKDLNRTVLFAISDEAKFQRFDALLNQYIESDNRVPPEGTPYAIMTTLYDVKYHTTDDIRNNCAGDLVFELINNNTVINHKYEIQFDTLRRHLETLVSDGGIGSYSFDSYDKMVQIKDAPREVVIDLAKNFDILVQAHTLRSTVVLPNNFNAAELTWGLTIRSNPDTQLKIGVIDNGVRPIAPIVEIVYAGHDITASEDALAAVQSHGTVVASLAAVGDRFFRGEQELLADNRIYSIKILENMDGYLDVMNIVDAIRMAHREQGIRLFNLSVCGPGKMYNEAPSLFAYLLDKLAYEEEILLFIAAGNMLYDDVVVMQAEPHDLHAYPHHFYSPSYCSCCAR